MKRRGSSLVACVLALAASLILAAQASAQTDPLPSWNAMIAWPAKPVHAKVVILGLDGVAAKK